MHGKNDPIIYAEKIIDLLTDTPYANAEIALKIAGNLLEHRLKVEMTVAFEAATADAVSGT